MVIIIEVDVEGILIVRFFNFGVIDIEVSVKFCLMIFYFGKNLLYGFVFFVLMIDFCY